MIYVSPSRFGALSLGTMAISMLLLVGTTWSNRADLGRGGSIAANPATRRGCSAAMTSVASMHRPQRLGSLQPQRGPLPVRAMAGGAGSDTYRKLQGQQVLRATDGQPVDITSLWGENDRAVVVFFRSFG
mmetsp:Transcript_4862/g.6021  ORF Transcript_4862/g.6021 Transcript_4862/m.6021 type:complete len:130 (-) Transcript_4862:11-400(-)